MTTVGDITYHESLLTEERERRAKLEEQVKTANYTQQLRDKAREAKELEEQREALHGELAGLNTQANTRAKLQLRRNEKKRKEEAMMSLIDKNAATFRRLLKSEPRPETMEAEVSAVLEWVVQLVRLARGGVAYLLSCVPQHTRPRGRGCRTRIQRCVARAADCRD